MQVLVVGAGAVGQVYAHHLKSGGARLAFLVKPHHAEACARGLWLYPLNRRRRRTPVRLEGFDLLTAPEQAAGRAWDQVWLAVASPALRTGSWLGELVDAVGGGARPSTTLVSLQPGLHDRALILERWPEGRFVQGLISMISYQAPLPGERLPRAGVAYWFPPRGPSPFAGPPALAGAVAGALRRGGCPAVVRPEAVAGSRFASAVLIAHMAALELCGWSFSRLSRSPLLALAGRAAREAIVALAADGGTAPPPFRHAIRPPTLQALMRIAPALLPLPVEDYVAYHFSKIREQTRAFVGHVVEIGARVRRPVGGFAELGARLARADATA